MKFVWPDTVRVEVLHEEEGYRAIMSSFKNRWYLKITPNMTETGALASAFRLLADCLENTPPREQGSDE